MSKSFSFVNWTFLLLLAVSLVITAGCSKDDSSSTEAEKSTTSIAFMHPDFRAAVVIRPQQILKSDLFTSVAKALPGDPLAEFTKEMQEKTGLAPEQVTRVVILANSIGFGGEDASDEGFEGGPFDESDFPSDATEESPPGSRADEEAPDEPCGAEEAEFQTGPIGIPEEEMSPTVTPFFCVLIDVEEGVDLAAVAKTITGSEKTTKHGKHSYYQKTEEKPHDAPSVHLVSKTTFLLAPEEDLKKILTTGKVESPLSKELEQLDDSNDLSLVVLVGAVVEDMDGAETLDEIGKNPELLFGVPPQIAKNAGLVKNIKAVTIAINLTSGTPLQVGVNTSDKKTAGEITKSLEELKNLGEDFLSDMSEDENPVSDIASKALKGLTISNQESRVAVALKLSQEDLKNTVETAVSFITLFSLGGGDSDFDGGTIEVEGVPDEERSGGEEPLLEEIELKRPEKAEPTLDQQKEPAAPEKK